MLTTIRSSRATAIRGAVRAGVGLTLFVILACLAWLVVAAPARADVPDLLANIPTVNQHDLGGAVGANACGQGAATMVLDYWLPQEQSGQPEPNQIGGSATSAVAIDAVGQWVKQVWVLGKNGASYPVGTTAQQIIDGVTALSRDANFGYGVPLDAALKTSSDSNWLADLKTQLDQKRPVIVFMPDGGRLWKNPNGTQQFYYPHWIVVSGYTSDGSIIYHDPYDGIAHGPVDSATFKSYWGTPTAKCSAIYEYLTISAEGGSGQAGNTTGSEATEAPTTPPTEAPTAPPTEPATTTPTEAPATSVPGTTSDQDLLKKIRTNLPSGDIFLPSALPDGWVLLRPPFPDVFDNGDELPDIQENPSSGQDAPGKGVWYDIYYRTASGYQVRLFVDGPSSGGPDAGEPSGVTLEGNEWLETALSGLCLTVWVNADQTGKEGYQIGIWSDDEDYATEMDLARLIVRIPQ